MFRIKKSALRSFLFLFVVISSFNIFFSQQTPTYASNTPFDITGTVDSSDPIFDTDKVMLDCTSTWAGGSNFHYETRQITVDKNVDLILRDVNNTPPATPTTTNDVSYGIYDISSTPFNASNLPLSSQCIGGSTNNLTVSLQTGKTYLVVIRHFNNAAGAPSYDLAVTSSDNSANIVVGAPGGAPPPIPKIVNITSSATNGNYAPGATISLDVVFDHPVQYYSSGTGMYLTLNNGSIASCTYCVNAYPTAASTTYSFTYDFSGSNVTDLDIASTSALDLSFGGMLKGTDGTNANITTPAPGAAGSLGANKNINVVSPQLTANNVAVTEGNSGTTTAAFAITLSPALVQPTITVGYATVNGTATTADNDYVATSGMLTFAPGETTKTINVTVNGDTKNEANETYTLNLSNADYASIFSDGTGTITNDDPQPSLSINNQTVSEGNSGTAPATYTVTLSAVSGQTVTVNYATVNDTATAADGDFVAASGTLTFAPGETTKTVNVTVNGDTKYEPSETYQINLSGATNATINTANGTGTITNDDTQPLLDISDVIVTEGNSSTTNAVFTVTMSAVNGYSVTVNYNTLDDVATTTDNDYVTNSGTLTFAPGETSKTITVLVNGDTKDETNETFLLALGTPTNASILNGMGVGRINNDDTAPTISIGNATVNEGDSGTTTAAFTVTLSAVSGKTVTVNYATANGTATIADNDYVATNGTLAFTAGETSKTVNVTVNGDTTYEADETFTVTLSTPTNATLATATGTGTITNDDPNTLLSISPASVTEGNTGTTTLTFTVTLSPVITNTVTVNYATQDATATTADNDYVATSGTLTFAPGDTSKTIDVTVNGDTKNEANETFLMVLSSPINAGFSTASNTGTINNDDAVPSLSIGNATLTEGNAGTTAASFTVTLSAVSGQTVTVDYATANGTATTADNDYVAASGTLTFAPGTTTQNIAVTINGDTKNEANETFSVTLSAPTNATITTPTGTGTITNDDTAPTLSIGNTAATEGNAGTTTATFTVTLSAVSGQTVTVDYATANGTATTADNDYVATSGTLTFAPGTTTQTIVVTINGDTKNEANETFSVTLSAPANATIVTGTGTGTITNDDATPTLSIGNATVTEGNAGTANATFTVTLSAVSGQTVTVDYATANVTATTADNDYVAASGTLTFPAGTTSQTFDVMVNGDIKNEANETFTVNLSAPTNATIATAAGTGTITNDDAAPTLSIGNATVNEGNAGTTSFNFTVTLSPVSGQTITVDYATANGTATTADNDYAAASGILTFAPGVTTQAIVVLVNGDTKNEANETFSVALSAPANATIVTGTGTGTITNDDAVPSLSINNVAQAEGNAGTTNATFTVTLSAVSGQTITVDYATANGTATTADNDYVATSGTLTFAPNETSKTIDVVVNGDSVSEANETFSVTLSNETNATIATTTGTGTITNDDTVPSVSIGNAAVNEGNAGTTTATFTVTLSAVSGQTITVDYATANGTATTADNDYVATSGTLTFTPGTTTQTITVTINGDTKNEADETFTVTLSNATNATIATATGTGTITNDDAVPTLGVGNATVTEGNTGTTTATFTVTLSAVSGQTVTVDYATANGTATTADNDYTAASGTLTFAAGVTSQTVTVQVNGDTKNEANETYAVNLSAPTNATIATAAGTGTITNDDPVPSLSIDNVTLNEGNAGTTAFTFTVTLSVVSGQTVTVDYATADDMATSADNDYTAASGTLTFAPGTTSQTVTVQVNGDTKDEVDETFTVNLSAPTNATIVTGTGTGTITNDDTVPSLSIDNVTLNEGNSGTTAFAFTVTLSQSSGKTVTVNYTPADGSALAGSDYTAASGTLTFAPNETSKTVNVAVSGETFYETDETFTVTLSTPTNATIATATGTGTITNDDAQPTVSINDMTLNEGDSGTTAFTFTVTRGGDTSMTTTVDYATADGSASATTDYNAASGTLTFASGETSKTITVLVNGDISLETDETFTVNLSNPSTPAAINDGQGMGTIINDDGPGRFSIADGSQAEGSSGTTTMTFTVTRTGDTTVTDTVDYATADNSATTNDNDYVATSGTLTFAPGDKTQTISVTINGDVYFESDENFSVNLSNPSAPATILDNEAVGTIINDDMPPGISVSDVKVFENMGSGEFTVTLSPAVNGTVTVDYVINDGTAVNGVQYDVTPTSGTLTFTTNITSQTIPFTVVDNDLVDGNHEFNIQLSNSSGPVIARANATATILDNEIKIVEIQGPPPATQCTDTNFENPGMIRTHFTNDADRAGLGCRLIAADGNYLSWFGSPLTSNANVGNQSVLNLGVVAAVDVFSSNGATGFVGDVNVCLKGSGYIIYLNANNAPRIPQLWSAWTTPSFPGYTCTTLYAPGTVILVQQKP